MDILHNFKPYPKPKKALYLRDTGEYVKDPETGFFGWEMEKVEAEVIGETDTSYVKQLVEYTNRESSHKDYGKKSLLPLGFHKERFLKWIPTKGQQLLLFDKYENQNNKAK